MNYIIPASPMFIPEIGGKELKQVEQTVNALLKTVIKIHADKPDYLIIFSSLAPKLHHRFSLASGEMLVRAFESNLKENEVVEVSFGIANELIDEISELCLENKIQIEKYHQEGNIVAIDDGSLSFMYYLSKLLFFPKILLFGISDLSPEKHCKLGEILKKFISQRKEKFNQAFIFNILNQYPKSCEFIKYSINGIENLNLKTDPTNLQMDAFNMLAVLKGTGANGKFHQLGEDKYLENDFVTGFLS